MRTLVDRSMRGWLLLAALAACTGAGAAQSAAGVPAIEFHVKPGGVQPFTSSDAPIRPQLGRPGKQQWETGGIEPGFWLSGGGIAERPFATLFQAQLAVRELLRAKGMPEGAIRVVVLISSSARNQSTSGVPIGDPRSSQYWCASRATSSASGRSVVTGCT